ncbi:MAG TPA: hypothetical protein VNG95_04220 [Gemmatimonadales bacterium]|nr:hypothetical protein [Gemmatimonadales bacterium]
MRRWLIMGVLLAAVLPIGAAAQQFTPPQGAGSSADSAKLKLGLYGFGVRTGIAFSGSGQLVLGTALDLGNLFSPRVRLRPSGEIGVFNGTNTYIGSLEGIFRFTDDDQPAVPYVGAGLALAGHENCGADPKCPGVWVNLVLGFELRYRTGINWLLEYHGMDAMRHHRIYIGLTTRRGS